MAAGAGKEGRGGGSAEPEIRGVLRPRSGWGTRIWQLFAEHEMLARAIVAEYEREMPGGPVSAGGRFGEAGSDHADLGGCAGQ